MRVVRGFLVVVAVLLAALAPFASAQTPDPVRQRLEREKLEEEVRKLRSENDWNDGWLGRLLTAAPFVTVVGGVVTVVLTLRKHASEVAAERREIAKSQQDLLRQQEQDRAAREQASLRRFDENLATIITNLGADKPALQVNAAAALNTFLKPRYADLHCELLSVIKANLKLASDPAVADMLRHDLERVVRLVFAGPPEVRADLGATLDLTRLSLTRLDLSGVDADGVCVDVAFSDLTHADLADAKFDRLRALRCRLDDARLTGASLREARCNEVHGENVHFGGAVLVSATFAGAILPRADFRRAQLQGSHFENAELTGAQFEQADLADAYFRGIVLDDAAKRSMATGAVRWRDAHFADDLRAELEAMSAGS